MDESTIRGMELLKLNDGGEPSRILPSPVVISVTGYNTWVQEYTLELALTKHFSSCGEITDFYFPRDNDDDVDTGCERGNLESVAFMRIVGEDSLDKALKLDGTNVGGWIVTVKAASWPRRLGSSYEPTRLERFCVTGFDTSLPEIDLQMALCEHFCTCGEVIKVLVYPSYAHVALIGGKRCVKNALKLSGSSMGGMNLVVEYLPKPISRPRPKTQFPRTSDCTPPWIPLEWKKGLIKKEMEMAVDEKKKEKMMIELMKIDKQIKKLKGVKPEKKSKKQILENFAKCCQGICSGVEQ